MLRLINQDNVLAVLGEVASSRSLAAAPICQQAGVPMISPASTNPKVTEIGDYIFRTCFIDPFQGASMAQFRQQRSESQKRCAAHRREQRLQRGLAAVFKEEFTKSGGNIVAEAILLAKATRISAPNSPASKATTPM